MLALPANADQHYQVSGRDRYQIGQTGLRASIVYSGTQTLTVTKDGKSTRFTAQATYTRSDAAGSVPAQASFVQEMTPQGDFQDRIDLDPDYLTVLNQPFAVELDAQTLNDLLHLRGKLPFVFPAPMTGGTLRGYLERGPIAPVNSRPALGVRFDASGPMSGPLPGHPHISITGTMVMRGTAYYAMRGQVLLLALDETLRISGNLRDRAKSAPVNIVYARSIKADSRAQPATASATPH